MDENKIGNFMKALRKSKNVTQMQVAEALHVDRSTIGHWETGYSTPDCDMLVCISQYYEVDVSELINGQFKDRYDNPDATEEEKCDNNYPLNTLVYRVSAVLLFIFVGLEFLMLSRNRVIPIAFGSSLVLVAFILQFCCGVKIDDFSCSKKERINGFNVGFILIGITLILLPFLMNSILIIFLLITSLLSAYLMIRHMLKDYISLLVMKKA